MMLGRKVGYHKPECKLITCCHCRSSLHAVDCLSHVGNQTVSKKKKNVLVFAVVSIHAYLSVCCR